MIINTDGIIIQMECSGISLFGRVTSGVKLINLSTDATVASIAKVREASAELESSEEIAEEIVEEDTTTSGE